MLELDVIVWFKVLVAIVCLTMTSREFFSIIGDESEAYTSLEIYRLP